MDRFVYSQNQDLLTPIDPQEQELLPRLPRSLPFDALVFIIEDRITGLVQLPYTLEQVYGSLFYVQVIRPIVASLILPENDSLEPVIVEDQQSRPETFSAAASIRAAHFNKQNVPPPKPKPYNFADQHRGIVAALLVARLEFLDSASDGGRFGQRHKSITEDMMFKERGVLEARAYTAELVALKFLSFMTLETDRIEFLTWEYNIDQDGVNRNESTTTKARAAAKAAKLDHIQSKDSRVQAVISSRSMVHLPLRPSSRSRSNSISTSRGPSPKGRQPVPIAKKSSQSLFYLSNSVDDKRNLLYSSNSFDNNFRNRASSFTENSPLLGTSAGTSRVFENPFAEDFLSAATNPTAKSSFQERPLQAGWGDSPHDRLVEHGLFIEQYADQSALDLAIVGSHPAREFISSDAVQSVMAGIWSGRIMYWKTIEATAKKTIHLYNPRSPVDWYSRLRVPRYRSFFMMINYSILMTLFYVLLFRRHHDGNAGTIEIFLHVWFVGFVLDEVNQAREAGSFGQYIADFWAFFDLCIVAIFIMFAGLRLAGLILDNEYYTSLSFDVLSLEAVLLVPRLFSFLFIFPYFGTLLPCLRDLSMEFFKFLVIIVIIYVGFLTTFSFLGRQTFTFEKMSWLLIRVFFGSSFAGFDAAPNISPVFGPPLMLIFVTLTNILLITVLISILSQKFSTIMLNARQEYALHFSAIVIESVNTSNRVTYFYPPINILGSLLRIGRPFLTPSQYRALRIFFLKATHWPFVALVYAFEQTSLGFRKRRVKKYMKARKDRRHSVQQRIVFQNPEPQFHFEDDYTDSDGTTSEFEDHDVENFGRPRHAMKRSSKMLSNGQAWQHSETFFPRIKKLSKR